MFHIVLSLCSNSLYGLDCLDFCRQHGLPDRTTIRSNQHRRSFDVDEGFARAWFSRTETTSEETITVDMLRPEELLMGTGTNISRVFMSEIIDIDRAKELYVAAIFRRLRKELDRLREDV